MAHLLYIKASPMGDLSYSSVVADAFADAYAHVHPRDHITNLDLFYEDLPPFDFEAASAKYKIMHGKQHSEQDRRIWDRIVAVAEDFKAADKYLFAVPMWNFSIPYRLKQYIDLIVQPTLTFTVKPDGNYQGLVTGRPALAVYARGGAYEAGSAAEGYDLQTTYLETILRFIGFTDLRALIVEPTLAGGIDLAERKKAEAIDRARALAQAF
jgi:FMN-dependent NADH-azoreductase